MPPKGAPEPIAILEGMAIGPSADAPLEPPDSWSRAAISAAADDADARAKVAPTALARPKNLRRVIALVVSTAGAMLARELAWMGVRKSVKINRVFGFMA
jgi:hypothetical protein